MPVRVAIVEDNAELRESIAQLLARQTDFVLAGAYPACEELLRELPRIRPDVVLMDIGLRGMSGIEGARLLRQARPAPDVLMLTVHEDEEKIFASLCAGASGYLLKKTPPRVLLSAIREIHGGGAPMTSSIARKVLDMFQRFPPPPAPEERLTAREQEVLDGLVRGWTYRMIAEHACISIDTVRSHIKKVYEKLHVHSKSEAVVRALRIIPR